ncbi:hypothetical protein ACIQU6_30850 [Streptomyces sp. NPDC090442]|uniref:hypothetical protein n=1 Tax=Streptomyces sp. NPDC090442 TaxID=3365962 RepID=UPI0037FD52CF
MNASTVDAGVGDDVASDVVRRVMELPAESIADLAWEVAAGDPLVQLVASLGADPETGTRVFADRWAAGAVLGAAWPDGA